MVIIEPITEQGIFHAVEKPDEIGMFHKMLISFATSGWSITRIDRAYTDHAKISHVCDLEDIEPLKQQAAEIIQVFYPKWATVRYAGWVVSEVDSFQRVGGYRVEVEIICQQPYNDTTHQTIFLIIKETSDPEAAYFDMQDGGRSSSIEYVFVGEAQRAAAMEKLAELKTEGRSYVHYDVEELHVDSKGWVIPE